MKPLVALMMVVISALSGAAFLYAAMHFKVRDLDSAWVAKKTNDDGSTSVSLSGPGRIVERYHDIDGDGRLDTWILYSEPGTYNSLFYSIEAEKGESSRSLTRHVEIGPSAGKRTRIVEVDTDDDEVMDSLAIDFFDENDPPFTPVGGYLDLNYDGRFDVFRKRGTKGDRVYLLIDDAWTEVEAEALHLLQKQGDAKIVTNSGAMAVFDFEAGEWAVTRAE